MTTYDNLLHVGDHDFEAQVLKSDTPVIVDFSAAWCPPCHALMPVYQKLSGEYAGRLRFAEMDVDEHPITSTRLGIQAMPTLVIFKAGKEIGRVVGPMPARLKKTIDSILAENAIV